jgi:CO dehydrogenase nickel-insertion accessory protein CooC1
MRKVSREVITAFLNGQSKKNSNTSTDGNTLYLFGNKIAEKINDLICVYDGGHRSVTTKERLDSLISLMEEDGTYLIYVDRIFQKNYDWYFTYNNSNSENRFFNELVIGEKK